MEFLSKQNTSEQAIISTLAYFDIFKIPLNKGEISEYLLFKNLNEREIDKILKQIHNLKVENGYYSLGLEKNEYEDKFKRSKEYWKRVDRYRFIFSICPYIKLVCVCNSLCINDTDENSDIDLLIITERNRIFLARLFITILTSFFGVRRHGRKIKQRFCLSFFVSESNLDFKKIAIKPFDIYLAYWIKTLQPIAGDYKIYEELIDKNKHFLKNYFSNKVILKRKYYKKRNLFENFIKKTLETLFSMQIINKKIRSMQLKRAGEKMINLSDKSGTIINDEMLKFHDNDMREKIRLQWKEKLSLIVKSTLK